MRAGGKSCHGLQAGNVLAAIRKASLFERNGREFKQAIKGLLMAREPLKVAHQLPGLVHFVIHPGEVCVIEFLMRPMLTLFRTATARGAAHFAKSL